jgi:hypothetical protein
VFFHGSCPHTSHLSGNRISLSGGRPVKLSLIAVTTITDKMAMPPENLACFFCNAFHALIRPEDRPKSELQEVTTAYRIAHP